MINALIYDKLLIHMFGYLNFKMCRFSEVAKIKSARELYIEVDIETIFLSPGITYAAYLVFMIDGSELQKSEVEGTGASGNPQLVGLTYKLKEVSEASITYFADVTNDGWMIIELCQFICYKKVTKLEVFLENTFEYRSIVLEGIQFLPIEKVTIHFYFIIIFILFIYLFFNICVQLESICRNIIVAESNQK